MSRCPLCNGNEQDVKGDYSFKARNIGDIIVPNVAYTMCDSCQQRALSPESSEKVFKYVLEVEANCIKKFPIADFIAAGEAADLLGVSKQRFSQNLKIKRGFVYSVEVGDRVLYHKRSVLRFKDKRDGRFSLNNHKSPLWFKSAILHKGKRNRILNSGFSHTQDERTNKYKTTTADTTNKKVGNDYALEA